ncbi:MAG: hypothetical protein M1816_001494 [Peltula sp. TS41687]|nr:MAG: hypothetical protein M1816_001494 [Peltula sp. TS41687]
MRYLPSRPFSLNHRAILSPSLRHYIPHAHPYATQTPGAPTPQVFNRQVKYLQRERAGSDIETSRKVDYLRDEVAARLCERLLDINRHFPVVLDLGANACHIARALTSGAHSPPLSSRLSKLIALDSSPTLLHRDSDLAFNTDPDLHLTRQVHDIEASPLPYDANTFDCVLSSCSLHWINDLPSLLAQINHVLKPDSPFLAAMIGGDSLYELRTSLQLAELERRAGLSQRVSPLADVSDVAGLLQRAGFRIPTVDVDDIVVEYPSAARLMMDLQAMGEGNAVLGREVGPIRREVMLAAEGIYRELHGDGDGAGVERKGMGEGEVVGEGDEQSREGGLPATFRIIYMIGWKEGPNQARPLARGSGEVSMKDFLEGGGIDKKR